MRYWECSCRLWAHFVLYCIQRASARQQPLGVGDHEMLGRAIYSDRQIRRSTSAVKVNAFLVPSEQSGISVDRIECAPRKLLEYRAGLDGHRRRTPQRFKGYAELRVSDVRTLRLSITAGIPVCATPKLRNPAHADLVLPPDDGDDLRMEIADAIIQTKPRFVAARPR